MPDIAITNTPEGGVAAAINGEETGENFDAEWRIEGRGANEAQARENLARGLKAAFDVLATPPHEIKVPPAEGKAGFLTGSPP